MYFYIASTNNDLQHHGIMGQKWGVRRFQNKDGSLTSAGRKRYDDDSSSNQTSNKKGNSKKIAKKVAVAAGVAAGVAAIAGVSYLVYKNKNSKTINAGKKVADSINKNKTLSTLQKEMQNRESSMNKVMSQFDSLNRRAQSVSSSSSRPSISKVVNKTTTNVKKPNTNGSSGNLTKELEKRRRAMERTMSAFDTLNRSARR